MKKQKSKIKLLILQKTKFAKHQIHKPNRKITKGGNSAQSVMVDFIIEDDGFL